MGIGRNAGEGGVKLMEWKNQEREQMQQLQEQKQGELYVKVMTDEQMDILRRQISVYATICEQLVEMHKAITAQQDLAGMRLGNLYCDPLMTYSGHKITARQRWTPTPMQLQILEHIFDQGIGTPSKQKIKEIASELTQHGQISETNVYNWFQNRRARSKRKQMVGLPNCGDSEVETEVESSKEKKAKSENPLFQENPPPRDEDLSFQSPEISSKLQSSDPLHDKAEPMFRSDVGSKSSHSLGHLSFYESVLSNPSFDHLFGKVELPGSFSSYKHGESFDIIG